MHWYLRACRHKIVDTDGVQPAFTEIFGIHYMPLKNDYTTLAFRERVARTSIDVGRMHEHIGAMWRSVGSLSHCSHHMFNFMRVQPQTEVRSAGS